MRVQAGFNGDWDKLGKWARDRASHRDAPKYRLILHRLGLAIQRHIATTIKNQEGDWIELADYTKKKKGHDKIYIETGKYIQSLSTIAEDEGPLTWSVTIAPIGTTDDGWPYIGVAKWLEYGTSTIPARPLWRPTYSKIRQMDAWEKAMQQIADIADIASGRKKGRYW